MKYEYRLEEADKKKAEEVEKQKKEQREKEKEALRRLLEKPSTR